MSHDSDDETTSPAKPSQADPNDPARSSDTTSESDPPGLADERWQTAVRARFEACLAAAAADEAPPRGIAPEILAALDNELAGPDELETDSAAGPPGCDQYTLWSATTALVQEVKLQGRAFQRLTESLSELSALPETIRAALRPPGGQGPAFTDQEPPSDPDAQSEASGAIRRAERREKELLEALLDTLDRLVRGREAARAHLLQAEGTKSVGWPLRLFRREPSSGPVDAARAFERGYQMSLERLEESLQSLGIAPIDCVGRRFDPSKMNAVGLAHSAELADGTVVELVRPGYEAAGKVIRHAAVTVARHEIPAEEDVPHDGDG